MRSIEDIYHDILKVIENADEQYRVNYIPIGEGFDICLQVYKATDGDHSLHLQLCGEYPGKRRVRICDYRIHQDIMYAVTYIVNCAIRLAHVNAKE